MNIIKAWWFSRTNSQDAQPTDEAPSAHGVASRCDEAGATAVIFPLRYMDGELRNPVWTFFSAHEHWFCDISHLVQYNLLHPFILYTHRLAKSVFLWSLQSIVCKYGMRWKPCPSSGHPEHERNFVCMYVYSPHWWDVRDDCAARLPLVVYHLPCGCNQ